MLEARINSDISLATLVVDQLFPANIIKQHGVAKYVLTFAVEKGRHRGARKTRDRKARDRSR
jgi:hypothetical protein